MIPLVQKVPRKLARAVSRFGFAMVPSMEGNKYGQGVYFTGSMSHANDTQRHMFRGDSATAPDDYVFLISLVAPGNSYPVVESASAWDDSSSRAGKACVPGYQSHYVLLSRAGDPAPLTHPDTMVTDELVLAEAALALPLFIVEAEVRKVDPPPFFFLGTEWTYETHADWIEEEWEEHTKRDEETEQERERPLEAEQQQQQQEEVWWRPRGISQEEERVLVPAYSAQTGFPGASPLREAGDSAHLLWVEDLVGGAGLLGPQSQGRAAL